MHGLVEYGAGRDAQFFQRLDVAGGQRKGVGGVAGGAGVEHLEHGNAAGGGVVDQRLDLLHEGRVLGFIPKRTLPEGFLYVDDDQRLFHGTTLQAGKSKGCNAIFTVIGSFGECGERRPSA
ncbi:hypothetical protein D9M69_681130 [compost metagenome]